MILLANAMTVSSVTLSNGSDSSEANDEGTSYLVANTKTVISSDDSNSGEAGDGSTTFPGTSTDSVTLPSDGGSSEAADGDPTYIASEPETETDEERDLSSVSKMLMEDILREQTEEGISADLVSETETEVNDESGTPTVSKTLMEKSLREQTEKTRLNLVEIAEDEEIDDAARSFAWIVAEIIDWWQTNAEGKTPTSHLVDFGMGSPINLLMVLALVPERYQGCILIRDKHRSPFNNWESLSWLHEQTIDVLVRLCIDPIPTSVFFAQGLASMVRDDVDEGWRIFTGRSWLEDQLHLLSSNELDQDLYRFSSETEKIVFLFNPTEIHWTVVEVDLDDAVWTYTLYNSLSQGKKGPTWRACERQFPLLEKLICRVSGISEPETREIVTATSAQQNNSYDCGPMALFNAVELLEGRRPQIKVDAEVLRLKYLTLILEALCLLGEDLETPAFRARMRKVCLEYSR